MQIKELLATLSGEEVTVLLNKNQLSFVGVLTCSRYGAELPAVDTGYIELRFAYDCVHTITCSNSNYIIALNLNPKPKETELETEAPTPAVLIPLE